ncbi:bacteriohemerythrin [Thioalkalivibrio thiocyanodenitrificans]|uniref:bacteriohemerythrin n=1 Tax=Thioalkalivibrio thiocyanodenitrificans TaxID=243063 RepID=UPI000366C604|nr:bacteriohemerythrin [Thioalkalivibrio thiocyanodenitrificans]
MAYFEWSRDLDTGIPVIDKQHKRIVEYINRLHKAVEDGHEREGVQEVLDQVVDYTLTHFAFEEEMLEIIGYPETRQHQELHRDFSLRIQGLQGSFSNGQDIAGELAEALRGWLLNHIREDDHAYGPLVRDWLRANAPEGMIQR